MGTMPPTVNYQLVARRLLSSKINENALQQGHMLISEEDVYVVWFCKTLQNWKALLAMSVTNGMYYEVTFNGDKNEYYIDAYQKTHNEAINGELIPLPAN